MGYLPLLPALLLPLIGIIGLIARSRRPGAEEVARRQNRYLRNNLILGAIVVGMTFVLGYHRYR
jgi:hypothetical protein